jgi:hypothetical protein
MMMSLKAIKLSIFAKIINYARIFFFLNCLLWISEYNHQRAKMQLFNNNNNICAHSFCASFSFNIYYIDVDDGISPKGVGFCQVG